jgi:hypothetical protein
VGQAKAAQPEVRGSGVGSYCRTAGGTGQEPEGSEHVAQAKAARPEMRGSGDGSLILTHGGHSCGGGYPRCARMRPKPKQPDPR